MTTRKSKNHKASTTSTSPSTTRNGGAGQDALAQQLAAAQQLASAIPSNTNKPLEHGHANALKPPRGLSAKRPSPAATGSTLSEENSSDKTGSVAPPGVNAGIESLDRVRVDSAQQAITTNQGVPVADNQNSLKAGLRGPALLEDFILREKITHFDHERIPERIVHARGSGAHGYFECYEAQTALTKAAPFKEAGKITPVFVRFSTVQGERGSKDTARDVRGFAVKFYTDEGNWDFASLMPESTHMLMWAMSDRAIPRSLRMLQGFGVHTFRLVNDKGESVFCKFHWNPVLGTRSLVWDEAVKISGADPDFHRRDLWDAIEAGDFPEWELGVQVFTEEEAEKYSFDVLDATKIVPEELVPVKPLGRMVLNRNPDNFFAETEQVAFCAAHVIPGIDFSNDPLLAGRIHSYVDTQISRLGGPNFHEIPINSPVAQVHNNQRDGMHRQAIHRGRVAYEPNSLGGGCPFQAGAAAGFVSFPQPVQEDKVRGKPEKFADHYTQATLFYQSQTPVEQAHIAAAFRFELSKCAVPAIRERMVASLVNVSTELASKVAAGLGMPLPAALPKALKSPVKPEVAKSPALSLMARPGDGTVRTLKVAILAAEGADAASITALQSALKAEGAMGRVVGQHVGSVPCAGGKKLEAEASLENEPGFLFDGLVLPDGEAAVKALSADGHTAEFIKDQYRHGKTILALGASKALLSAAGIDGKLPDGKPDAGILFAEGADTAGAASRFIEALAMHRHWQRETDPPRV